MKSLFRILAVTIALLLFAAALMFYWGGQQMEFKAETLIKNTDITTVMNALGEPEAWYDSVVEVKTSQQTPSEIGTAADITILDDGTRSTLNSAILSRSDASLTVRTWNEKDFDVFSIWQLEQAGRDVQVRQLMLATHKGLYRFDALLNKQVLAVVNFKPKQIADYMSECLLLGIQNEKDVVLLELHKNAYNGTKVS